MKQIIIIRTDLGMSKGKMCSQASHASLISFEIARRADQDSAYNWFHGCQAKIVVKANSEDELLGIYDKAIKAKLPCSLIKDAARTQLSEPAYTAACVGPAENEDIDKITKDLKLL
jgi:PTH2 family peptidyl-tRNA hydrolase